MTTLTLADDGPTPNPLSVSNGSAITISNTTGASLTVTMSHAGLFNPSQGTTLTVPTTGFTGTVGRSSGTYSYTVPDDPELAQRNGTITIT